jgi:signal transduction histidine kinase
LDSSKSPRQRSTGPAPWLRKNGALAIGCVAGVALVVLARSPLLDREADISREIELITRSVETEVQRAWDSGEFRPSIAPLAQTTSREFLPLPDERFSQPIELDQDERDTAFDLLLAESKRAELAQDWERAWADLGDARTRTDDSRRLVLADLRAVQIAARAGWPMRLAEAIDRLLETTQGNETLDGTSVLLTAAAAALPMGDGGSALLRAARAKLEMRTVDALRAGELELPPLQGRLQENAGEVELLLDPARKIYLQPLIEHGGAELAQAAQVRLEHDRYAWIIERFGSLPWAAQAEIRRSPTELIRGGLGFSELFLSPSRSAAWILEEDALREQLAEWLQRKAKVPPEVEIRLIRQDEVAPFSELLPRSLARTPYGVVAWLKDPYAYQASVGAGYRWLRIALHALGLTCALLGFALHRQRQRELAVQHLKSEFVANVSHELRTPLASILLMAENLSSGKVGEQTQARYHELILRESQRLRRLVDDVLDFSRLDRGEGPRARIETVSLKLFGADLRADLQAWAEQHELEFSFAEQGLEGEADLDVEALRRAVFNLADNALRHSGSKQIELQFEADAKQVKIRLRDHGKGLPEGSEERIFRPFEQLNPGSTTGKGAGLGLAIVAEIARAHGGQVNARNLADGGALFILSLPRHHAS